MAANVKESERFGRMTKTSPIPSYGSEMRQGDAKKSGPGGKMPLIQEVIGQGGNGRNGGGAMPSIQAATRQGGKSVKGNGMKTKR
jgi:hypothetical protein